MKNLILILVSCFAFSQEPAKPDTAKLSEDMKTAIIKAEIENQKAVIIDKKLSKAEKENEILKNKRSSLYAKFKIFFREYFGSENPAAKSVNRSSAVKEENRNDPVEEIEVYDGTDSVRAGWFYRIFHKNDYVIRRYKRVNNEKIYLD